MLPMDNPHAQPPSSQTLQQRSTQSNPHLPALSGPLAALPAATQASLLALFSSNCFNADPATLASLLPLLLPGISSARSGQATETGLHSLQTLSQVAGASLHNRQNGASQGISGGSDGAGGSGSPDAAPSSRQLDNGMDPTRASDSKSVQIFESEIRRKERNKQAQKRYRDKRKDQTSELSKEVENLKGRVSHSERCIQRVQQENAELRSQMDPATAEAIANTCANSETAHRAAASAARAADSAVAAADAANAMAENEEMDHHRGSTYGAPDNSHTHSMVADPDSGILRSSSPARHQQYETDTRENLAEYHAPVDRQHLSGSRRHSSELQPFSQQPHCLNSQLHPSNFHSDAADEAAIRPDFYDSDKGLLAQQQQQMQFQKLMQQHQREILQQQHVAQQEQLRIQLQAAHGPH